MYLAKLHENQTRNSTYFQHNKEGKMKRKYGSNAILRKERIEDNLITKLDSHRKKLTVFKFGEVVRIHYAVNNEIRCAVNNALNK